MSFIDDQDVIEALFFYSSHPTFEVDDVNEVVEVSKVDEDKKMKVVNCGALSLRAETNTLSRIYDVIEKDAV